MRNYLLHITLIIMLLVSGCSKLGNIRIFGKKRHAGIVVNSDIERLRMDFQKGKTQALEDLIEIYKDPNQPIDIRINVGDVLAETHHPNALNTFAEIVSSAEALDLEFMQVSIGFLSRFQDNPKAADAMVMSMHSIEEKTHELHMLLVKNLNKVRTKDQIMGLLDLYEVSKANLFRTEKLLAETLGAIGNDEVIPILMNIARDAEMPIGVRNRAVEILGKKEATEVVGAFTELLGDPATNTEVRDFALNTMAGVKEERLVLTLLDTYNTGKKQYFGLLNTMLDALGDFDSPEVKSAVLEIALNPEYGTLLRIKAIKNIGNYHDPSVIPKIIEMLNDPDNYFLYSTILEMVESLNQVPQFMEEIRRIAFHAHQKETK